ncbi:MAG TPA: LytR C-terminal domain-containing protein [Vitreimonas sp.]|nr:LytR C-terminal domain-containing protein [Vitreimonas sp.]
MFDKKSFVLTFLPQHLYLHKVVAGKPEAKELLFEADWTKATLATVLASLQPHLESQPVGIILSDHFSYVLSVQAPPSDSPNLVTTLSSLIPEDLTQTLWHSAVITEQNEARTLQVVVLTHLFSTELLPLFHAAEIEIKQLQPISIILAHSSNLDTSYVSLYADSYHYLGAVVEKDAVKFTKTFSPSFKISDLTSFLAFAKTSTPDLTTIELNGLHINGDDPTLRAYHLHEKNLDLQTSSVADSLSHNTFSPETLNNYHPLKTDDTIPAGTQRSGKPSSPRHHSRSWWMGMGVLFLALVLMTAAASFFIIPLLNQRAASVQQLETQLEQVASPTPSPLTSPSPATTPIPEESPEPGVVSNLRVNVLNASGKSGEAQKVKTALTEFEFAKVDLGNTEPGTATTSTLQAKASVPPQTLTDIQTILNNYDLITSDPLTPSSEYDVVIVIRN